MASSVATSDLVTLLENKAAQLRIDSVKATTEAGSGHPTSCASAADIVATLFFSVMRYDPKNPKLPNSDRFILSKGHAAPLLYAAWAEAGLFPREELLKLRTLGSDLEGHPTPRLSFVDTATGSLGQGLSAGVGMALCAKIVDRSPQRIYVLMGDGESVEGSVWEAAEVGQHYNLDNLCAIIDANNGQIDGPVSEVMPIEPITDKWRAFGWHVIDLNGHDFDAILKAYREARELQEKGGDKPVMIVARTVKGKGVSFMENQIGWHGVAPKAEEAKRAIDEIRGAK